MIFTRMRVSSAVSGLLIYARKTVKARSISLFLLLPTTFLSAMEDMHGTFSSFYCVIILLHRSSFSSPGRFFAANELKAMMAYLVMNYDIELEEKGVRPPDLHFQTALVPNPKAKVKFRARNRD